MKLGIIVNRESGIEDRGVVEGKTKADKKYLKKDGGILTAGRGHLIINIVFMRFFFTYIEKIGSKNMLYNININFSLHFAKINY